jgi:hypothetical protein
MNLPCTMTPQEAPAAVKAFHLAVVICTTIGDRMCMHLPPGRRAAEPRCNCANAIRNRRRLSGAVVDDVDLLARFSEFQALSNLELLLRRVFPQALDALLGPLNFPV